MGQSISSHSSSGAEKAQQQKAAQANPELAQQFSGLIKQKRELAKKELQDAVEEAPDAEESATIEKKKHIRKTRERTELDDEPSIHKTIQHIQNRLIRLSRGRGQKERAKLLKEHAQKNIDELKSQGYQVSDLELPDEHSSES